MNPIDGYQDGDDAGGTKYEVGDGNRCSLTKPLGKFVGEKWGQSYIPSLCLGRLIFHQSHDACGGIYLHFALRCQV